MKIPEDGEICSVDCVKTALTISIKLEDNGYNSNMRLYLKYESNCDYVVFVMLCSNFTVCVLGYEAFMVTLLAVKYHHLQQRQPQDQR